MKRLLLLVLTGLLAACSNFGIQAGTPSVEISNGGGGAKFNVQTGLFDFSFKVVIKVLPGSPGGNIAYLNLVGGGNLAAGSVEGCANIETDLNKCRYEFDYSGSAAIVPTYTVESYVALNRNNESRLIKLPVPVRVF
jgi:hypothetical protein